MATAKQIKLARIDRILQRQDPPGWGSEYIPSILATRAEAPPQSRPARILSALLGRYCHVLSVPERKALLLALYDPNLFELHEQRMLATDPRPHPLQGHPKAMGLSLLPLRGTVAVADRLGLLKQHSWVFIEDPDKPGATFPVAVPFIGDLLLFREDSVGPFCVNWTIKAHPDDFEEPFFTGQLPRDHDKARTAQFSRHAIEEAYHRDAGIRTVRVTEHAIDIKLAQNLGRLFTWHGRRHDLHEDDRLELVDRLRASVARQVPPLEVFLETHRRIPYSIQVKKVVLFQAIWKRELRVDLFDFMSVDTPLRPESVDVLVAYAKWFAREEV